MKKNRDASKLKYSILLLVHSAPGLSRYRLRKYLSITSSKHIKQLIQDLIDKKFVKEEFIKDSNSFNYYLTDKGIQFVENTKTLLGEFFDIFTNM